MSYNLPYFLALNRIPSIGPKTVAKLLATFPRLETLFTAKMDALCHLGLSMQKAAAILGFDRRRIDADLAWAEQRGNTLLTWESKDYPPLLKEIADPPFVLYAKGDLTALANPTVAIVGTRSPTHTGIENARYFAGSLAEQGVTIVSGLALGIDKEAHQTCVLQNKPTIAVLATGIDTIYPQRHRSLAEKITEHGLILSEFPLKNPPIAGHFPRRNRIISGLSLITMVIEAATKSGSLITARLAAEQNRDVLAIPGALANPMASGCHYLLQQGAKLVTTLADVLDELPSFDTKFTRITPKPLASVEPYLVKCIGFDTTAFDQIMVNSGLSAEILSGELAKLELDGLIKMVSGGYVRCSDER